MTSRINLPSREPRNRASHTQSPTLAAPPTPSNRSLSCVTPLQCHTRCSLEKSSPQSGQGCPLLRVPGHAECPQMTMCCEEARCIGDVEPPSQLRVHRSPRTTDGRQRLAKRRAHRHCRPPGLPLPMKGTLHSSPYDSSGVREGDGECPPHHRTLEPRPAQLPEPRRGAEGSDRGRGPPALPSPCGPCSGKGAAGLLQEEKDKTVQLTSAVQQVQVDAAAHAQLLTAQAASGSTPPGQTLEILQLMQQQRELLSGYQELARVQTQW